MKCDHLTWLSTQEQTGVYSNVSSSHSILRSHYTFKSSPRSRMLTIMPTRRFQMIGLNHGEVTASILPEQAAVNPWESHAVRGALTVQHSVKCVVLMWTFEQCSWTVMVFCAHGSGGQPHATRRPRYGAKDSLLQLRTGDNYFCVNRKNFTAFTFPRSIYTQAISPQG